jgi:hypothetical protein
MVAPERLIPGNNAKICAASRRGSERASAADRVPPRRLGVEVGGEGSSWRQVSRTGRRRSRSDISWAGTGANTGWPAGHQVASDLDVDDPIGSASVIPGLQALTVKAASY